MTMRTELSEKFYQKAIEDGRLIRLYDEPAVQDFKYWRIVKNRFQHDRIANVNHMIVLKRECPNLLRIWPREWRELFMIVQKVKHDYDTFTYNLPSMSSVVDIPHVHLYKLREEYK